MQYRLNHFLVVFALVTLVVGCQQQAADVPSEQQTVAVVSQDQAMVVEAACGTCQFGLDGDDCELAVRFEGTAYFVDGTSIDDHGDAHATDGFCNTIRPASVQGVVENGRFLTASFALLADNSDHAKQVDTPQGGDE